jgi:hypothetical protein
VTLDEFGIEEEMCLTVRTAAAFAGAVTFGLAGTNLDLNAKEEEIC